MFVVLPSIRTLNNRSIWILACHFSPSIRLGGRGFCRSYSFLLNRREGYALAQYWNDTVSRIQAREWYYTNLEAKDSLTNFDFAELHFARKSSRTPSKSRLRKSGFVMWESCASGYEAAVRHIFRCTWECWGGFYMLDLIGPCNCLFYGGWAFGRLRSHCPYWINPLTSGADHRHYLETAHQGLALPLHPFRLRPQRSPASPQEMRGLAI